MSECTNTTVRHERSERCDCLGVPDKVPVSDGGTRFQVGDPGNGAAVDGRGEIVSERFSNTFSKNFFVKIFC